MTIKVAVVGATGRMGRLALELIKASQDFSLFAALDSKSELPETVGADVVLDVTNPEVSPAIMDFAIANGQKLLVGTSGWSAHKLAPIEKRLETAPNAAVVVIPNFSIGSMLATKFAAEAAKYYDSIEIVEAHHAGKVDSPSGTAVRTAELIAAAREIQPLIPGVGQAARGVVVAGVPIHSLRLNGVSAKQDIMFGGDSELLTLSHETTSVDAYAAGILLCLRATAAASGLTVGLQAVIESQG
jgi:4-hydroxy-tetrahydrodipicolinate reductase